MPGLSIPGAGETTEQLLRAAPGEPLAHFLAYRLLDVFPLLTVFCVPGPGGFKLEARRRR